MAASEEGLCAILLGDDAQELKDDLVYRFSHFQLQESDQQFADLFSRVLAFIESPSPDSELNFPLDIQGTAFQKKVWQVISTIAPGSTLTYSDIANEIDSPKAVRAVAGACGANPLAIVIPCHRVVAKDGSLSGYRWGVERKRQLLEEEGRTMQYRAKQT
jgi:AraC family transcriptional regulator of adaptative response/methylated-DNA-[protein]-cysteine methyltransferase